MLIGNIRELNMQLTPAQMNVVNQIYRTNLDKAEESKLDIEVLLNELNKIILKATRLGFFDPALIDYVIQFGTILRKGEGNLKRISIGFFYSLRDILKESFEKNMPANAIVRSRYLVFETLTKSSKEEVFLKLGKSLVWFDEQEKINELLKQIEPSAKSNKEIQVFLNQYKSEINHFTMVGKISDFMESLRKILATSRDMKSNLVIRAKKIIGYLVLENDVVPDSLGIFGLADDIQLINDFRRETEDFNHSHQLLSDFTNFDDTILSLFFERYNDEFGVSKLTATTPHINYVIGALTYLLGNQKKRVVSLVPDTGFLAYIFIINLLTVTGKTPKRDASLTINKGDVIYFNILEKRKKSIAVRYLGEVEGRPDLIWVGNVDPKSSKDNASLTMPKFSLSLCSVGPKYENIIADASEIINWQKSKIDFVPTHLSFHNSNRKIFLLTRKKTFLEAIKSIRPFGLELSSLVNFEYHPETTTYKSKVPSVFVYSDPEKVKSDLEENDSSAILVSDDPTLANQFLSMFVDTFMHEDVSLYFFSSLENAYFNENSIKRGFEAIYFPSQIEPFLNIEHKLTLDDPISKLEEKFFKTTKPIERVFHRADSDIFEIFITNARKLFKEQKNGERTVSEKIIFKLIQARDLIFRRWIPIDDLERDKTSAFIEEISKEISFEADYNDSLKNLQKLFEENKDSVLNVSQQRGLLRYLKDHSQVQFHLLEEKEASSERARKFMEANNIQNVTVISFSRLKGQFLNSILLVPYQMNQKINQYLNQNNTADKIEYFLFENEKDDFDHQGRKSSRSINKFQKLTKKTFLRTPLSQTISGIKVKKIETSPLVEPLSELETEFLESKTHIPGSSNLLRITEAIPFFLDDKRKLIFLTPGSRVIKMNIFKEDDDEIQKFEQSKASDLIEGDRICIPVNSKTDMFEQIASRTNKEYTIAKHQATSWKRELKYLFENRFSSNLSKFSDFLQSKGIKRVPATYRNWLGDNETLVAPLSFQKDLKLMCGLNLSEEFERNIDQTIQMVQKVYKIQAESSDKFLEILNAKRRKNVPTKRILVNLANVTQSLELHEISLVANMQQIPYERLWKIDDL